MQFLSDLYPKQFQYLKNICLNSNQPNSIIITGSDYNTIRKIAFNYAELLSSPNKYQDIDSILKVLNGENMDTSPYIHIEPNFRSLASHCHLYKQAQKHH